MNHIKEYQQIQPYKIYCYKVADWSENGRIECYFKALAVTFLGSHPSKIF